MSEKKDNSKVKAAIIGGVATIIATVLSAIIAPIMLVRMKAAHTVDAVELFPALPTTDAILATIDTTAVSTESNNMGMALVPSTLETQQVTITATAIPTGTPFIPTNTMIPTQSNSLEQFIRTYYQAINNRNYEYTWSLLSDTFKANFHSQEKGGYQGYADFWNTVDRVEVLEINILEQSSQSAKVFVAANYHYKNGGTTTSERNLHFVYDITKSTWLFDI